MATQAQIEANRRNARHSTGPKTAEGKAAGTWNAVTHGFGAVGTLLNHEDPQVFAAMLARYITEWRPQNEHEAWLVRQMAEARWRLERMRRIETAVVNLWVTGSAAMVQRGSSAFAIRMPTILSSGVPNAIAIARPTVRNCRTNPNPRRPDRPIGQRNRRTAKRTQTGNEPDFTAPYSPFARSEAPPPYMTK